MKIDKSVFLKVFVSLTCDKKNLNEFSLCPPFEEGGGHIALHMSVGMLVGMSISLNLVQLITQERFVPEASNLVGR